MDTIPSTSENHQESPTPQKKKINMSSSTIVFPLLLVLLLLGYFVSWKIIYSPSIQEVDKTVPIEPLEPTSPSPEVPTSLSPSTYGKIKILNEARDGTFSTIGETFPLLGSIESDGDYFVEVSLNNSPIFESQYDKYVYGSWDPFYKEHFNRKFSTLIKNLQEGRNTLKIELFSSPAREQLIDQLDFQIVTSKASSKTSYDFTPLKSPEPIESQDFLSSSGIYLEKIWEYASPFTPSNKPYARQNVQALKPGLHLARGIEIYKIGSLTKQERGLPVFLIRYRAEVPGHESLNQTIYIGYVQNEKFNFFTNTVSAKNDNDAIYQYFMKPADEILEGSIYNLTKIDLPNSKDFLVSDTDAYFCNVDSLGKKVYETDNFKIIDRFVASDIYNMCRDYRYIPTFFEEKDHDKDRFSDDDEDLYVEVKVELSGNKSISWEYTPRWYWCNGSRGYRYLDKALTKDLIEIGKTKTGEKVYTFSPNFKYPQEIHLLPANKDQSNVIEEENWKSFLQEEKENYPFLVIKDAFNNFQVYIREGYVFFPGC